MNESWVAPTGLYTPRAILKPGRCPGLVQRSPLWGFISLYTVSNTIQKNTPGTVERPHAGRIMHTDIDYIELAQRKQRLNALRFN